MTKEPTTLYTSHSNLSPNDTLEAAKRDKYKKLVIAGIDENGLDHLRCSNCSKKDVLWLAKQLEEWALHG